MLSRPILPTSKPKLQTKCKNHCFKLESENQLSDQHSDTLISDYFSHQNKCVKWPLWLSCIWPSSVPYGAQILTGFLHLSQWLASAGRGGTDKISNIEINIEFTKYLWSDIRPVIVHCTMPSLWVSAIHKNLWLWAATWVVCMVILSTSPSHLQHPGRWWQLSG